MTLSLTVFHATLTGAAANTNYFVDGPKWDAGHTATLSGFASPSQGGTGVANNDSSTLTISGSFGITFTVSATTSLTLPTSGTLVAVSGLTDNAILRADGTGAVQGSDAILDDSENLSAIGNITGKAGGITITGGTGSGDDLRITSSSHATKGTVNIGSATLGAFYDEVNDRLSVGANEHTMTVNGSSFGSKLSVHSDTDIGQEIHRHSNTAGLTGGALIYGARSGGTEASPTIATDGMVLFGLAAVGYDGTDYALGGEFRFEVDGTPGANDMPTRIVALISPDGSQTPAEVWRIQQNRDMLFTSGSILTLQNTGLHLLDTNASHDLIVKPGSDLTADRTLTVTTGDADRTLSMGGNITTDSGGNFTISGGNSVTLTNTNTTSLTLPTTGTLATLAGSESLSNKTLVTPVLGVATATSINGVTLDNNAWSTYTPTVTAAAGTFTTVSATGRYKQIGKTVDLQIYVTITTAGTAAGQIKCTLPVNAVASQFFCGMAKESALTGKSGACQIISSDATIVQGIDSVGTTFIASGGTVNFGLTYEAA